MPQVTLAPILPFWLVNHQSYELEQALAFVILGESKLSVKVFICSQTKPVDLSLDLLGTLSKEELTRLASISDPKVKNRFLNTRLLLKLILSKYFNTTEVLLRKSPTQKPYLEGIDLNLSISHSKNFYGFIFGPKDEICGIDIEAKTESKSYLQIAKQYFHKIELEFIQSASEPYLAFRKIWTLKEAYLKTLHSEEALKETINTCFDLNQQKFSVPNSKSHLNFRCMDFEEFSLSFCYSSNNSNINPLFLQQERTNLSEVDSLKNQRSSYLLLP